MGALTLTTPRLQLIAATPALLRLELEANERLVAALGVQLPADWPPSGGEYDRDAISFFLAQLEAGGEQMAGWSAWYVTHHPLGAGPSILVANCGYFGPPDPESGVEIGYSVSAEWRNHGFATEFVRALVENAVRRAGVRRVQAHVRPDNAASLAVLRKNGFREQDPDTPEMLRLVWLA